MFISKKLRENFITLVFVLLFSILLITIIGYYDEGHHRIYGSFINYLGNSGQPPLSDYILWGIIFGILGMVVFNILEMTSLGKSHLANRIILSMVIITIVVTGSLTLLFSIFS
ncbi:MAG: hypothetical protein KJO50_08435 [Bacteroidia bacterium]|nr:hypothetical protein [Bacteroidia bacterium]